MKNLSNAGLPPAHHPQQSVQNDIDPPALAPAAPRRGGSRVYTAGAPLPRALESSSYFGPFYRGDACGALQGTRMNQSSWSRTYGSGKEGYTPEDEFTWDED